MSYFFDNLCGIYDSDKIPLIRSWAQVLNRHARQLLLPLYRRICVSIEWDHEENMPQPTYFIQDAVSNAFHFGRLYFSKHWETENFVKEFVQNLPSDQIDLFAFYMHSTESAIKNIEHDINSQCYDDVLEGIDEDQKLATVFQYLVNQVKEADIIDWLEDELGNLDNFLSLDLLLNWDESSVNLVNESFSRYIGISSKEIKLYPDQGHEYYTHRESLEIFVHTENFSNHVPAKMYGPNLVPKGYHLDLGDRMDALKTIINRSLLDLMHSIEIAIHKYFKFEHHFNECQISYTFFCPFQRITTLNYEVGINFLQEILQKCGEHNFDAHINIELSRKVGDEKHNWGTQIHIAYGSESWMDRDENTEYPVWMLYIENEHLTIDEVLSQTHQTNIVASVIANLARCYALEYESN